MSLASRTVTAARRSPVWLAGLALLGTWAFAQVRERESAPAASVGAGGGAPPGLRGLAFWKRVLYRTYQQINDDRLLSLAAGVVFYGLLALFPAITALVSSYALFADPSTINDHLAILAHVMPASAYGIVHQQITRIASSTTGDLSFAFLGSFLLALWSANAGLKAVIDALNIVYGVKEWRGVIRLNMVSLAMTIATIFALLLAIAAVVVAPIVIAFLPLGGYGSGIVAWLRWPTLILLLMLGLALLYRFGPNREHPRWQWFSAGTVFAVLAWLAGSLLLSWYLSDFANYNATYGSLGAAVGLMMWLWMTAIVILVGAEINSEIEAARQLSP